MSDSNSFLQSDLQPGGTNSTFNRSNSRGTAGSCSGYVVGSCSSERQKYVVCSINYSDQYAAKLMQYVRSKGLKNIGGRMMVPPGKNIRIFPPFIKQATETLMTSPPPMIYI